LDGWYTVLRDLADIEVDPDAAREVPADVEEALCDDLNTPEAFAAIARHAAAARAAATDDEKRAAKARLLGGAGMLGLLREDPEHWFQQAGTDDAVDAHTVQQLVDARTAAKAARNFPEADRIRGELAAMGIAVEDTPQGPRWKRITDERTG